MRGIRFAIHLMSVIRLKFTAHWRLDVQERTHDSREHSAEFHFFCSSPVNICLFRTLLTLLPTIFFSSFYLLWIARTRAQESYTFWHCRTENYFISCGLYTTANLCQCIKVQQFFLSSMPLVCTRKFLFIDISIFRLRLSMENKMEN